MQGFFYFFSNYLTFHKKIGIVLKVIAHKCKIYFTFCYFGAIMLNELNILYLGVMILTNIIVIIFRKSFYKFISFDDL